MKENTYSDVEQKAEAATNGVIAGFVGFLKEFWLWILIPFVLVIGGLLLLWFLTGDDAANPFQYNVF